MKRSTRLLGLFLLFVTTSCIAAQSPPPRRTTPVRFAVDVPYPPMEIIRANGTFAGFDIALGNALCEIAGLRCTWVAQSWDGILAGLSARKYDAILSAMAITPDRRRQFEMVGPYVQLASVWFVPGTSDIAEASEKTFAGKRLGVQRGTVHDAYVTERYGAVADVRRYRSTADMAVDFEAGRLAAVYLTEAVGDAMFDDTRQPVRHLPAADGVSQAMGIALRRDEQALARTLRDALETLQASPRYDAMLRRWLTEADRRRSAADPGT